MEKEFSAVQHFMQKDGNNSSFLMKMFEYYTNSHPRAQEMREQIQSAIIGNMGELRSEKDDIAAENFKLEEYQEKLAAKYELLKKKFIELGKKSDTKQQKLGLQIIPPVEYKVVSERQKKMDAQGFALFRELLSCSKDVRIPLFFNAPASKHRGVVIR